MFPGVRRKPARLCCGEGTLQPCDLTRRCVAALSRALELEKIIQPELAVPATPNLARWGLNGVGQPRSWRGWNCSNWAGSCIGPEAARHPGSFDFEKSPHDIIRLPCWSQVLSKQWLFRQNSRRAQRSRESARNAPCPSGDRAACPMARAFSRLRSSSAVRSPGRAPRRHRPALLSPRQPGQPRLMFRNDSRPVLRNPASAQLAPHPRPGRSEFSPQTTSSTPSRTPPFPKSGSARPL
jgi:hypothetical protein